MQISKVRIDGQFFFLRSLDEAAALRDRIVEILRSGADFATFETIGHGTVDVLITAALPVRFESIERAESDVESMEADPPPLDYDCYLA